MTDEFSESAWLRGDKARAYAKFVSSIVSSLQPMAEKNINQVENPFHGSASERISIECFDYTIEAIIKKLNVTPSICRSYRRWP